MQGDRRQNERQVMIRIIKLLFSFADMAERAAYRSILVRTFLLTLFRIAEPVARRYVLRYDGNALKIPEPLRGDGISGRAEALHLAWLFRLFAMMLTNLMAWRDWAASTLRPSMRRPLVRATHHRPAIAETNTCRRAPALHQQAQTAQAAKTSRILNRSVDTAYRRSRARRGGRRACHMSCATGRRAAFQ